NAYICSLDLKRVQQYEEKRRILFELFLSNLDLTKYYLPFENMLQVRNTHFCLPVIVNLKYKKKSNLIKLVKSTLDNNLIERRPIISQSIGRQLIYKEYCNYKDYENSEYLSKFGLYVGLFPKLKGKQVIDLCIKLNDL
ncbi:MAG: DegT/DnrJ/EryC1/StrS family aminotransferase, partial [Nanoarchaeota archaeon]